MKVVEITRNDFPQSLLKTDASVLYCMGNINLLYEGGIGVVGTRHPSMNAINYETLLVTEFSKINKPIISGLALGSDTIAHKTALENNAPTIAVLPSGINNPVPYSNKKLALEIVRNNGLLISEYSGKTTPKRNTYIARNRIIASLSDFLIINQCSLRSGTMHTVNFGLNFEKQLFTYYFEDGDYSGNIELIKNEKAINIYKQEL